MLRCQSPPSLMLSPTFPFTGVMKMLIHQPPPSLLLPSPILPLPPSLLLPSPIPPLLLLPSPTPPSLLLPSPYSPSPPSRLLPPSPPSTWWVTVMSFLKKPSARIAPVKVLPLKYFLHLKRAFGSASREVNRRFQSQGGSMWIFIFCPKKSKVVIWQYKCLHELVRVSLL